MSLKPDKIITFLQMDLQNKSLPLHQISIINQLKPITATHKLKTEQLRVKNKKGITFQLSIIWDWMRKMRQCQDRRIIFQGSSLSVKWRKSSKPTTQRRTLRYSTTLRLTILSHSRQFIR